MDIKINVHEARISSLKAGDHFYYPVTDYMCDTREYVLVGINPWSRNIKPLVRIEENVTERMALCPDTQNGDFAITFFVDTLTCLVED